MLQRLKTLSFPTSLSPEDDVLPLHDGYPLRCEVARCLEAKVAALGRVGDVAVGPRESRVPVSRGNALHLELVLGDLNKFEEER